MFERLGFQFTDGFKDEDWDVLWSMEYPYDFDLDPELYNKVVKTLKPHQKVNHFPGMGHIANKMWMTTHNYEIKAVLPGFVFPSQKSYLKNLIKNNPNARFVFKYFDNRGVKLVKNSGIDVIKSNDIQFYQYFMERPLLIDGKAWDFWCIS